MSGFSNREATGLIKGAIEPILRKLICAVKTPGLSVEPNYEILSGVGSWTMPANATAVSIYVSAVGDTGNRPTLQSGAGTSDLYASTTLQWGTSSDGSYLTQPLVITTADAGDLIFITYTTQG